MKGVLLAALDPNGVVLVDVVETSEGYTLGQHSGANLSTLSPVQPVLANLQDERGDKYAGLAEIGGERLLVTVAPVRDESGALTGALLMGTPLREILLETKSNVLADLIVYQPDGSAALSTFVGVQGSEQAALPIASALYTDIYANLGTHTLKVLKSTSLY
jgi:hypothetical protein